MSSPETGRAVEETTELMLEQRQRLRKVLGRFDMIFFTVAAILVLDTVGQISSGGGETLTWAVILVLAFIIPYGLVMAELGSTFTQQGGAYEWMKMAWGRFTAGIGTILYWATNPFWIGGSLAFISTEAWSTNIFEIGAGSFGDYLFKLIFIWFCITAAIISLRYGKWIPNVGAFVKVGLVVLFSVTVVIYGIDNGFEGLGDVSPSLAGLLGVVPLLIFAYVGFELQNSAAEEMKDPQKDVPVAIGVSGVIVALCYVIPILGILLVIPKDDITGIGGFLDAVTTTFSVYGGAQGFIVDVATLAFIFTLLVSGSVWMIGTDRSQAVAGADGAFFGYVGKFSEKLGTPVRMNVVSGIVSSAFMIAAINLTSGDNAATFEIVLITAISTTLLSYLVIIPTVLKLRKLYPDVRRPYRVPGGETGLKLCTAVATAWIALASWVAIFPGTLEGLFGLDYAFEEIWGVSRARFELWTIGTLSCVILFAIAGYYSSRGVRERTAQREIEAQPAAVATPSAAEPV